MQRRGDLHAEKERVAWRLLLGVLLLTGALASGGVRSAGAQSRPDASQTRIQKDGAPQGARRSYTVALVGIPLGEALERLLDETQLSLAYASERVAGRTTYCRAERAAPEQLLACVLRGTGLDYARLSSGTYVLIPDPRGPPRYGRVTGQVVDASTGMPLPNASVLLADAGGGTATNEAGRFAFADVLPGVHRLIITHVAYHDAADTVLVHPDERGQIDVALRPRVVLSPPMIVSGFEARRPSEVLGLDRRAYDQRMNLAGVGAEDVVQGLGAVAGVRLGDALSDVHMQGGASGEQLFLLDGAPVFIPVPNGGFVGPFSPFAIRQVTVRKAGFEAGRGSHLSGVIDVRHRFAAAEPLSLTAQVDPLGVNVRASGTVTRGERAASWMVAGRRGLWSVYHPGRLETLFRRWGTPDDFLLRALRASGEGAEGGVSGAPGADGSATCCTETPGSLPLSGPLELGFSDLHVATRLRLGGLRSVKASFYRGAGAFGIEGGLSTTPVSFASAGLPAAGPSESSDSPLHAAGEFEDRYRWTNYTGQLTYEWVPTDRLFAHARLWGSSYRLAHAFESELRGDLSANPAGTQARPENFNQIEAAGLRLGGDYAWSDRHLLSGALEAAFTQSDFAISLDPFGTEALLVPGALQPVAWRLSGFVEDEIALGGRVHLTPGARLTVLPAQQTVFAEPRLAARYDRQIGRGGSWAARAAVGLYRQYLSSFDAATTGAAALLPRVRFWLPVGRQQRPPKAYHATLSALLRPNSLWELKAESYYKHQPRLWTLGYGTVPESRAASTDAAAPAGGLLARADGYAYGFAFTAERRGERVQAEAQYEYAVARRRIEGRFGGAFVPVPWSAPHQLRLSLDMAMTQRLTATVRWQGLFRRSWGFRQAYYDLLEPDPATRRFAPFDLSDPAAHRLPAFSQWDVGVAYAREVGGLTVQGRVVLINALGRSNVTDWSLRADGASGEGAAGAHARVPRYAVPRLPSLSLRLSW